MIGDTERFQRAIARFDAANAEDPNRDAANGRDRPRELVYAERMTAMLARFAPEASEVVRLAARCQHIQRWKIPRADYPPTRVGYQQWRLRLRDFHAELSATILREAGYDDATIARVRSLIRKEALKTDAEAQMLEDVVDLTFLESYLDEFVGEASRLRRSEVRRHPEEDGKEDVGARARCGAGNDLAAGGTAARDPQGDGRGRRGGIVTSKARFVPATGIVR